MTLDVSSMFSQREFLPLTNFEPLLILTVKLASMDSDGLPPFLVYHNLYAYLRNSVKHVILSFDLSTSKGVEAYAADMKVLIDRLNHGDLSRCVSPYFMSCRITLKPSKLPPFYYLSC